jgi:hypothetical protein
MWNRLALARLVYPAVLGLALVGTQPSPAPAQINPSPIWGTSSAGGSGGTPTGPTNPGALGFGTSSAGGSGGMPTGPLNPNAYGYGTSTAAGSGGVPTGPTVRGLRIPPDLRIMDVPGQGAAPYRQRADLLPATASARRAVRVKPRRVIRRHR